MITDLDRLKECFDSIGIPYKEHETYYKPPKFIITIRSIFDTDYEGGEGFEYLQLVFDSTGKFEEVQ